MTFLSRAYIFAKQPFQGTNLVTLLLSPTGSSSLLKEPMETDGLAAFCLYTIPCFFTSHTLCLLPPSCWLLAWLSLQPWRYIFLWIVDLLSTDYIALYPRK
jgi:hypothetical protein